jgi:metallo-beta-lactamase class B
MNPIVRAAFAAVSTLAFAATVQAAPAPAPASSGPPDWSAFKAHVDKAKAAAGIHWAAEETYFCNPGQQPNLQTDPTIEPQKLFDNVSVIGDAGTVVYVVTTPEGVVLIDSSYPTKLDSVVLPGLTKLGIDPASVKYVLITHGHADHYGGSKWFQDHGARVAISAKDWDVIASGRPEQVAAAPRRDIVAEDSKPIVVGGVAFTPVETPGHTPGSMGYIFPVQDGGRMRMAAIFGSSILRGDRLSAETVRAHADGLRRFGALAAKAKVEVELQNHPLYDNMWEKAAALKTRRPGDPNPFVVGAAGYRTFVTVMDECLRATIARKGGRVE